MHNLITSLINIIDNYTKYDFYIGQTNNPKQRLKQHKQSKNFNFMIVIYKSSKEIIDILEYSLINFVDQPDSISCPFSSSNFPRLRFPCILISILLVILL